MEEFRKDFPVLEKYTYLNTASCGLVSKPVIEWRREQDDCLLRDASVFRDKHKPHIESIRSTVARFLNANENEVSLVPNFSFGFNTLLEGLFSKKKVLLLKTDYPSINWAVENRSFEVCYASIDGNLEQNIEEAVNQHKPDVFAFSLVQYINGVKIDFGFLQQLKAYRPNLILIADGTQFLGAEIFSFSDSPLDVVGSSGYKWLLGGYGNGFFLIKDLVQPSIIPKSIGFNSADATYSKKDDIHFIKRFEPGHQDTLNYGTLQQSINYMESIGMGFISERVRDISTKAKHKFSEKGLLDEFIVEREIHSNIFNIKGDSGLFNKLKENDIICSQRGNGIRVSFHFYNSEKELDKLIETID